MISLAIQIDSLPSGYSGVKSFNLQATIATVLTAGLGSTFEKLERIKIAIMEIEKQKNR